MVTSISFVTFEPKLQSLYCLKGSIIPNVTRWAKFKVTCTFFYINTENWLSLSNFCGHDILEKQKLSAFHADWVKKENQIKIMKKYGFKRECCSELF